MNAATRLFDGGWLNGWIAIFVIPTIVNDYYLGRWMWFGALTALAVANVAVAVWLAWQGRRTS